MANSAFEEKRGVELVWNGKTNEICNVTLPFQVIEQVDEPRKEKTQDQQGYISSWLYFIDLPIVKIYHME